MSSRPASPGQQDSETTPVTTLDPKVRNAVLRMIPYGVHVITTRHESQVSGSIVDWVTQTSFEPPLIAVCLRKDSFPLTLVRQARQFALHPLGEGQKEFAKNFFKFKSATDNQINGQSYRLSANGLPILDEAPAAIEAAVIDELDHGDHALVLARVMAVEHKFQTPALLLQNTGWKYGG